MDGRRVDHEATARRIVHRSWARTVGIGAALGVVVVLAAWFLGDPVTGVDGRDVVFRRADGVSTVVPAHRLVLGRHPVEVAIGGDVVRGADGPVGERLVAALWPGGLGFPVHDPCFPGRRRRRNRL